MVVRLRLMHIVSYNWFSSMISVYLFILSMLLLVNNLLYPPHAFIYFLFFWWPLAGFQHCPLISFSSFGFLKCICRGKEYHQVTICFSFCFVASPLSLLVSVSVYYWLYDFPHDWWKVYETSWHGDCFFPPSAFEELYNSLPHVYLCSTLRILRARFCISSLGDAREAYKAQYLN